MRHGASMMGPDYTHWHGGYEVAKHFYTKFIPKVLHVAEEEGDETLKGMVEEILAGPMHQWMDGQDAGGSRRAPRVLQAYVLRRPTAAEVGARAGHARPPGGGVRGRTEEGDPA